MTNTPLNAGNGMVLCGETPTIYHGTPLAPRAALLDVCKGRAMCVSFWRPDDVEVVEAISHAIMFRQRRILRMAGSEEARGRMVYPRQLEALLRLARTKIEAWSMGRDAGCAGSAEPAQRCTPQRVAVRAMGRSTLAHGRADRSVAAAVRPERPGVSRMDRTWEAFGPARLSRTHGRGGQGFRQSLAQHSHDARNCGGSNVALHQRGWNNTGTERVAI